MPRRILPSPTPPSQISTIVLCSHGRACLFTPLVVFLPFPPALSHRPPTASAISSALPDIYLIRGPSPMDLKLLTSLRGLFLLLFPFSSFSSALLLTPAYPINPLRSDVIYTFFFFLFLIAKYPSRVPSYHSEGEIASRRAIPALSERETVPLSIIRFPFKSPTCTSLLLLNRIVAHALLCFEIYSELHTEFANALMRGKRLRSSSSLLSNCVVRPRFDRNLNYIFS